MMTLWMIVMVVIDENDMIIDLIDIDMNINDEEKKKQSNDAYVSVTQEEEERGEAFVSTMIRREEKEEAGEVEQCDVGRERGDTALPPLPPPSSVSVM